MASDELERLARMYPDDFKNVARRCDGPLGDHLEQVYQAERTAEPIPADD